jgi:NADPH:quinone reductase
MRAISVEEFGSSHVLRLRETPTPVPGPGEVLVRLRAAGVNPVETYLRSGTYTRTPSLPWTPGSDGAGVVEAVGQGVARVAPGDRVYVGGSRTGTYAELCVAAELQVHPLPERLSFAQGAALHVPYATAWRALVEKARMKPGEFVVVHGASGGVGLAAVQIARAAGAVVIGTAGTPAGRDAAAAAGALHVLDHRIPGHLDALTTLTDGHGADVIVEMLADRNLDDDLAAAALHGRVVIVGSRGRIPVEPRRAMTRDVTIFGMSLHNASDAELDVIHRALAPLLADGTLVPVIREDVPLVDAYRAHDLVMAPGALGKIVLVP